MSSDADRADKYALYEQSVQSPDEEVRWLASVYRRRKKKPPLVFREDFCGSAALSTAWVESDPRRRAIARDVDARVLAYAYLHHALPLGRDADRLELRRENVLQPTRDGADLIAALNFSHFVFKERREMLEYLRAARRGLREDGMLFLDLFGGITAQQPSLEPRHLGDFEYFWEQESFDPLTNGLIAHIHFAFPDGSMLRRAFTYDWRVWTCVELRELLAEAGYSSSAIYWEERLPNGRHTGNYRPQKRVDAEPGWNAYAVAER